MKQTSQKQRKRQSQNNARLRKGVAQEPLLPWHDRVYHLFEDRNPRQQLFENVLVWRLRQIHILVFGKNWKPKNARR